MVSLLFGVLLATSIIQVNCMIGGDRAPAGMFPYVATIQYLGDHLCNGAIFNETHILTLGSCVSGLSPDSITVIVGAVHLNDMNAHWVRVEHIRIHPQYLKDIMNDEGESLGDMENDIAVLSLAAALVFTETVQEVIVSHDPILCPCCQCQAIGWSPIRPDDESESMIWINTLILRTQDCLAAQLHLAKDELCALDVIHSVVMTDDDYGTPIICDGKMVALLSGINSATNRPFAIRTLAPHFRFIFGAINGFI